MTRISQPSRWRGQVWLAVLLLALPAVVQAAGQETVVAPGDPPLTREGIARFTNFIEWLLDVPLTDLQKQQIEESLRDSWTEKDKEGIQGYVDVLGLEAQTSAMKPEERSLVREQVQPQLLEQLRAQPDDEGSKWLLAIYEAGHEPIAEGTPPLTRQTTDAFVELFCFMLGEAAGMKLDAPAELRDEMAKTLAAGYGDLSAEQQAEFSKMPLTWAAYKVAWPGLPAKEKTAYRTEWKTTFKPYLDKIRQAAQAAQAAAAPKPAANQAAAKPASSQTPAQSLAARQAQMYAQQTYFQTMQNVLQMQAETGRIMAANMGSSYSYQYRY